MKVVLLWDIKQNKLQEPVKFYPLKKMTCFAIISSQMLSVHIDVFILTAIKCNELLITKYLLHGMSEWINGYFGFHFQYVSSNSTL